MKKKISIVISLFLLLLIHTSCDQEEQINSSKSVESEITIDKSAQIPFEPTTLKKDEIAENSCDDPLETILYGGQHIVVGKVYISNDDENLFVTYDVSSTNWWLQETHLYVGDIEDAPFGNTGNPKIGHFPYHGDHDLTKEYTFTIPLDQLDDCFSVISHAVVVLKENGSVSSKETAFGYGENEFDGSRWGWFLDFCEQSCDKTDDGEDSDNEESQDGSNGDNNNGQTGNTGEEQSNCTDAYAFNTLIENDAYCFEDDGFNTWGWTNKIAYSDDFYRLPPVVQIFPIYADAFHCDISQGVQIGEVQVTISAGDSEAMAKISYVISDKDFTLTDLNLYVGIYDYPMNSNDQKTIDFDYFNYSLNDFGIDQSINNIPWPLQDVYFIAHARVCPTAALP